MILSVLAFLPCKSLRKISDDLYLDLGAVFARARMISSGS